MTLGLVTRRGAFQAAFSIFDAALDRSGWRQLEGLITLIEVGRGYLLAKEGEVSHDFFVMLEGIVKLWNGLPDGRRQIVAFRGPADPITLHRRDTPWPITVQAISACKYYRIRWEDLLRMADRYPMMQQALFDHACDEVANLENRLLMLGRKTTEEKLASFILEFCRPLGSLSSFGRQVELPMRRAEIAEYLGLTAESVSREFSRFKHERLIGMPRPSSIVVLNRSALEAIARGRHGRQDDDDLQILKEAASIGS